MAERKPKHHEPMKAVKVEDDLQHHVLEEYCEYMRMGGRYMVKDLDAGQKILAELASIRELLKAIERKL